MDDQEYIWTIREVKPEGDNFKLRVNSNNGPSGSTSKTRIGKKRMRLLREYYHVRWNRSLEGKEFSSCEKTGAAAIYDFLFRIMGVD